MDVSRDDGTVAIVIQKPRNDGRPSSPPEGFPPWGERASGRNRQQRL